MTEGNGQRKEMGYHSINVRVFFKVSAIKHVKRRTAEMDTEKMTFLYPFKAIISSHLYLHVRCL